MKQYRKKPVVIEAVQYPGYPTSEIKDFVGNSLVEEQRDGMGASAWFINTLEGSSYILTKGDFIIKGVKGEFYPCKPDIFAATYEEATP